MNRIATFRVSCQRNARRVPLVVVILLISTNSAPAQLTAPDQSRYLAFKQSVDFCCAGNALELGEHNIAWTGTSDIQVPNTLTVQLWVRWDESDLEEVAAASGLDTDRYTLLCNQGSYGFQRRSYGAAGWTFFIESANAALPDTGEIPLPLGTWAHLAATYDGSMVRTYLDGQLQTETPLTGHMTMGGSFPEQCNYAGSAPQDWAISNTNILIGSGYGFTGAVKQLSVWDRALSQEEIEATAITYLQGNEPGLLGYWPMEKIGPLHVDGRRTSLSGLSDPPENHLLIFGGCHPGCSFKHTEPNWRLKKPLFVVREDLVEDAVLTDCASLGVGGWAWVDIGNDDDLDLVASGGTGQLFCWEALTPFRALIRDGDNGFVFDETSWVSGPVPSAVSNIRSVTSDFNGDDQPDVFAGNSGPDYCPDAGGTNTLLFSRPDGLLEDGTANILAPPCTDSEPQFPGQHPCHLGGDLGGRPAGVRYPGLGPPVPPHRDFTHSVAAGDIDGDDDIDIVVGNLPNHQIEPPYFLINDGSGGFLANWELMPEFVFFPATLPDPIGSVVDYFALADMDDDDHVDLVIVPTPVGDIGEPIHYMEGGIYWNDGSGDFSDTEQLVIEGPPGFATVPDGGLRGGSYVLPADIDQDNDKDLVLVYAPATGIESSSGMQILVNQGNRVFVDETNQRLGPAPQPATRNGWTPHLHFLDANGDGCPDLVDLDNTFGELPKGSSGIWLNNCEGNFRVIFQRVRPTRYAAGIPLDYDGDGDMDVLSYTRKLINLADNSGCAPGEGMSHDYVDFSLWINVNEGGFENPFPIFIKDGFDD